MDQEKSTPPQETQHKGFLEELMGDVFNLDRGLPATIWGMVTKPAKIIEAYFNDRGKYVTPLRYCIFILAVTTFISVQVVDYDAMMKNAFEMGAGGSVEGLIEQLNQIAPNIDWVGYFDNVGLITINLVQKFNQILYLVLMAPMFAFFTKLFFKKKKQRFIQHYVMMVYSLTTFSVFSVVLLPFLVMAETSKSPLVFFVSLPLMLGFMIWVTIKYLGLKGFSEILQVVIAFVLGFIGYSIVQNIIIYVGAYLML